MSIDGLTEGGNNVGIVRTGLAFTEFNVDFPILNVNNIVVTNLATGGATIRFTGTNGNLGQAINSGSLPTSIKDSEGRVYGIDKNGRPVYVGRQGGVPMSSGELNTLSLDKGVATFTGGGFYAFDAYNAQYENDILWKSKYEKIDTYGVGNKASAPGKPDVINVSVRFNNDSFRMDSVKFITSKGMNYASRHIGNGVFEVPLVGAPGADAQELYALHPKTGGKYWSLGKLFVPSYGIQKRKLVLVPVNGANIDESAMLTQINGIYNPVCVEWNVETRPNFQDASWDTNNNGLDVRGSNAFSNLTAEMKNLNKAYKNANIIAKNAIYLFVLNRASDSTVTGDMPRGHQFGYLFTAENNQIGKVAAHELGHGALKLKHPFRDYTLPANSLTTNLMNYGTGTSLSKYQWYQIHDPGLVFGLFEDDESALHRNVTHRQLKNETDHIDNTVTCGAEYLGLTPNGYPIKCCPNNVETYYISGGIKKLYVITGFKTLVNGVTKNYHAAYNDATGQFIAYTLNGEPNTERFTAYETAPAGSEVVVTVRKAIDNCYYLKSKICWNVPLQPLALSDVAQLIQSKSEIDGKIWLGERLFDGICGQELFKKDFGLPTGRFYSAGGLDAEIPQLIDKINLLVEQLMQDTTTYNKYIKNVMVASGKTQLNATELRDLHQNLELLSSTKELMGTTSLLDDIIQWIKSCNASGSSTCTVSDNLIPRCIWDNGLLASNNEVVTLPMCMGIIDGAYQLAEGLVDLGGMIGQGTINLAVSAFDELKSLNLEKIRDINCWINPISLILDDDCAETKATAKKTFAATMQFVQDPKVRQAAKVVWNQLSTQLSNSFNSWYGETFGATSTSTPEVKRCSDYHQGKLVIDIASFFVGAGEAKAVQTTARSAGWIENLVLQFEHLSNLLKKSWVTCKFERAAAGAKKMVAAIGLVCQLGTHSVEFAKITTRAEAVIEHVAPRLVGTFEQVLELTAPIRPARLTPSEITSAKNIVETALRNAGSDIMNLERAGLQANRAIKTAGNLRVAKTPTQAIVFTQVQSETKILALVAMASTSTSTTSQAETALADETETPNEDPNCTYCQKQHNIQLCNRLNSMAQRNRDNVRGVEKLCGAFPATPDGDRRLIDILENLELGLEPMFLKDLASGNTQGHIGNENAIRNLHRYSMKAWKLLHNAHPNRYYSRDEEVIDATRFALVVREDVVRMLGGEDGLQTIISKNIGAGCTTCVHPGRVLSQRSMRNYLYDLMSLSLYENIRGVNKVIDECKSSDYFKVTGAVFEVKVLAAECRTLASQVSEFELWRHSMLGRNERQRFIEPGNGRITDLIYNGIFVDFKSVNQNYFTREFPTETQAFNTNRSNFSSKYNQFIDYLLDINSMNQLEYWFDREKLNGLGITTLTQWKIMFQSQLININSSTNQLSIVGEGIFEDLWKYAKTGLRLQLFNNAIDENVAKTNFTNILRSNVDNNLFFDFIKFK